MKSLMNKTALKLLAVIFENPLHEFKEIELIKKAKTGKGSSSEMINNLQKEKILTIKRAGKTKIIKLNLQNPSTLTLKILLDQEKLKNLPKVKQSAILFFKSQISNAELIILFGSSIDKTSTKKSDIDILVIGNINEINKARSKTEELFGEKLNIHSYTKIQLKNQIQDPFIQNILLRGVIIHGISLASELFSIINKKESGIERLLFLKERTKTAFRNYNNEDYKTAKEIIERTMEQIIFYLLSEKKIPYTSKINAKEQIKQLPENKSIQKINKSPLKQKINLIEYFILDILQNKILET